MTTPASSNSNPPLTTTSAVPSPPPLPSQPNTLASLDPELRCSICTDLFYRPLTLLDCLHTFCSVCVKQWFASQHRQFLSSHSLDHSQDDDREAQERRARTRRSTRYTCPACRAPVRDTRPNASVTTLLDMYLAANPGMRKTEQERRELDEQWKRGESVMPEQQLDRIQDEANGEEILLNGVGELAIDRRRPSHARQDDRESTHSRRTRRDSSSRSISAQSPAMFIPAQTPLERESSIRSLISTSSCNLFDSAEMEAEIMETVVSGGLLDGIDLRNLSPQQEDEIIQRIVQRYRRSQIQKRQRAREREREREQERDRSYNRGENAGLPSTSAQRSSSDRIRPASRSDTESAIRGQARSRQTEDENTSSSRTRLPSRSRDRRVTEIQARSLTDAWRDGTSATARGVASPASAAGSSHRESAIPPHTCVGCSKEHIEYGVHYSCDKCASLQDTPTSFVLCQRCYSRGEGCKHWFGFGHAALARYERESHETPQLAPPHIMQAKRYVRVADGSALLQIGKFCDVCTAYCESCFWSCYVCNDGEWVHCNTCVGQARHCTHSLLATAPAERNDVDLHKREDLALMVRLPCSICHRDIVLNDQHLHCPTCDGGEFDVCMSCYSELVTTGAVSAGDGLNGWRRCPKGHRMLLITFVTAIRKSFQTELSSQPHPERLVLENVVGGWAFEQVNGIQCDNASGRTYWSWRDDQAAGGWQTKQRPQITESQRSQLFEPRQKMQALWTRVPDEETTDELAFPRGAEITEVVDINGDWAWGIYCRKGGLFPANYCRVIES